MREWQPQPLLCQYYGLRQFWKDRQRNWRINCSQIKSMSSQPKFQEHSIFNMNNNIQVCFHKLTSTWSHSIGINYLGNGGLARQREILWGVAQEWLGLKSDKVQTSQKSPLSVTPSMLLCVLANMIVELTRRKYFHSPFKGERYHKLKETNWYVLNLVGLLLSEQMVFQRKWFLSFLPSFPNPVLQKSQRGISSISCSCPKTWKKNSNRQIPLILLLTNIHGFLTCEYRQHEAFRFG